ncbi:MAG TPA: glycoside hydrolase family 3 C-terminal domain-containing protein [Candidatus Agrococcus pullicola]|uniref:Glycoside hydrolase family 3 C-terminal domain-containing protein n=1 Tax=Candidatus Agrococcus pullicola TaxID=2838429 RepID=A0A9D2CB78_9MICO|nr:glycoside hydrolase family 3 C-terminal domain-containing protein [Candidatus Agrococcus pullicola]
MNAATAKSRSPMSNKRFLAIWIPVLALVAIIVVVVNIALNVGYNWVASQLGGGTYTVQQSDEASDWDTEYYQADFDTIEDVDAAARDLVQDIVAEGIVLAKNEADALPLAADSRVTMLGAAAVDPVYGGAGSGSVDTSTAVTPRQGLENAGFTVNEDVLGELEGFTAENPRGFIEMDRPDVSTYNIGEMPVAGYDTVSDSFSSFDDAAVVYLARPGGEGGDLTQDMTDWDDNYEDGQHQLELNEDERDLIDLATENFDTVIVAINASTTVEMGPVQNNPDVDGILLIGSPGATGFDAVGEVLAGTVNPSGRTVDTWAADFSADPSFVNFGDFVYDGIEVEYPASALEAVASNADVTPDAPFVNYQEGIYIGYRYYETAAAEGFIDYDDAVIYPFGYGLSYTDFAWSVAGEELGEVDGEISVDIEVTNNGSVAGKDVVELFYSAPYTTGGIEKSEVVLGGFAKTGVIEPGASETVTITLAVEDMASYDYEGARGYVLEAGDYELTLRTDSHTPAEGAEPIVYTVDEDVVYDAENPRSDDAAEVTNQFDDVSAMFSDEPEQGTILNMSRADFAGTFPTAPTEDILVADDAIIDGFAPYDVAAAEDPDAEAPTTGADTDLTLVNLRGLPYDDAQWDELLDSLTIDEMTEMLLNGAYQTGALPGIAKPVTTELDGPAGFSSFINASVNGTAYPTEFLIAQTWNVELSEAMGTMVGNEALFKDVSGWYAPAMNLHRSPFGGRNFEYYSEDPFLSGEMGLAATNGAASKGLYTTLKHFALNDQEANRVNNGIAVWANEQAIRELYLKPFEMVVKNAAMPVPYIADDSGAIEETSVGSTAVMSSFNRIGTTWAGGSEALMTNVLRGEWGFQGFAISDFNLYRYMPPNQSIAAGTDLTLAFAPSKSFEDTSSATAQQDIRTATHNILYTVANSNAMNGFAPGSTVSFEPPAWRYIQYGATALLGVLVLVGGFFVVRRVRKNRPETVEVRLSE